MTDVVLGVMTEVLGEEATLLEEEDEKWSIVDMIGIQRTSVIWQEQIVEEKSLLGRIPPHIRPRAELRTTRRKKASKYRKKKFNHIILIFFGLLGFRPAVIHLQKNLYLPSQTRSLLSLSQRWNLT